MLKDTEYEAIGRLALAFNEVETVIDEYCPHILGASEWEVATILWDKKANFDRNRFTNVVAAIAQHYGPLKAFTDPIIELLKARRGWQTSEANTPTPSCSSTTKKPDLDDGARQGAGM